jgi:nucleobase:cation symporter-1, NCS1 family
MNGADDRLINEDLAPVPESKRTWGRWDIAALWIGMVICIPTYGLAAGQVAGGAPLWLAVLSIVLGNVIILVPMVLNAHAGTRYGIPFPVFLRSSFGVLGANVPAMMRALVACGWFGIQTWIGGNALYILAVALLPGGWDLPQFLPDWFGISTGQLLAFLGFWLINVAIIWRGMESIRVLERWAAPLLLLMGVALFAWAWYAVGDLGAMLATPPLAEGVTPPSTWSTVAIGLTSGVAFWGTLALNIPDFARFARSQREQVVGQAIGLPGTMAFFVFLGAAVTNASFVVFGTRISDPALLLQKIGGPALLVLAMFGLAIATLSTSLAANIVSPANDLSNLSPRRISFRKGAMIAAVIGMVIMPWKLWTDSQAYLMTWLLGYGSCLGAVGGVMIADYYFIRRCRLVVDDLYRRGGAYEYTRGFNLVALAALALGILPNVPGFLGALGVLDPGPLFTRIYQWGWFVALLTAGLSYLAGMKLVSKEVTHGSLALDDGQRHPVR